MTTPAKPYSKQPSLQRARVWRWTAVLLFFVAMIGLVRWIPAQMAVQALDAYENHAALSWLDWSERLWNDAGEIALERVRAYRRLRQFDLVRTHMLRAKAAGVSRDQLEREQWITLAQAGQLEQIESKLPELLNSSQVNPRDVCEAYATGFLLTHRPGPALDLIVPWLADYPGDAQAYYLRGQAHASARHYTEAEQAFREAWRLAPRRPDVALGLAQALLQLKQPEAALPLFEAATVDAALSDQAWLGVAQSARSAGQPEKALSVLQTLVEHAPTLAAAWDELGRTQFDQHDVKASIESLEKALTFSPNSLSSRQALARALMANGEPARAKPHLEFVAQATEGFAKIGLLQDQSDAHPEDIAIRLQIAELYRKYDIPSLAISWARSILVLKPGHAGAQKLLQDLIPETKDTPQR